MSAFNLKMSDYGRLTINTMRVICERDVVAPNPDKEVITFQAGTNCCYFYLFKH